MSSAEQGVKSMSASRLVLVVAAVSLLMAVVGASGAAGKGPPPKVRITSASCSLTSTPTFTISFTWTTRHGAVVDSYDLFDPAAQSGQFALVNAGQQAAMSYNETFNGSINGSAGDSRELRLFDSGTLVATSRPFVCSAS